jgi:hypothetical protein
MYDKRSHLTLFDSLNSKLKATQEPNELSSSIRKLSTLIVTIAKNIEMIPNEHEVMFTKLKTTVGSENGAKVVFFNEKLNQACDLAAISTFLNEDKIQDLKQLLTSLYISALEEQTNRNVVSLLKQKIHDTVYDIQKNDTKDDLAQIQEDIVDEDEIHQIYGGKKTLY